MTKRESELKRAFSHELKRQAPEFLTLLFATAGAPDRQIIGNSMVSFLEMKHATPQFESPGQQELMCMRLAASGVYCRYVIWWENSHENGQRTMIVHPRAVHNRVDWYLEPEAWTVGFDHHWLVGYILKVHGL